jgi:prepilin-type N-terminal cleavage/methylation domain-containing protein
MRKQAGFSLIEILCVLVILGVFGAYATIGFTKYISLYSSMKDVDVAIQQGQVAMNRLFLEVTSIDKSATGKPFVLDAPGATYSTPYKFTSLDGATPVDNIVSWDSSTKVLSINGSPICSNVSGFYMQKDPSCVGVSSLKYVTVSISITVGSKTQALTSQITLKTL